MKIDSKYVDDFLYEMRVLKFVDDETKSGYIEAALGILCTRIEDKFKHNELYSVRWHYGALEDSFQNNKDLTITIYNENGKSSITVDEYHINLHQLKRDYKIGKLLE